MKLDSHAAMKAKGHKDHEDQVRHHSGHSADVDRDKEMIAKAIHKHEKHDHKGSPLTKLKAGGMAVLGNSAKANLGRKGYASGGGVKSKKGGKSGNHVNVIVAPGGGSKPPMPGTGGGMSPAAGLPVAPPPRPPMAPQASPMGGMGGPPRPPMGPPGPPMGPPVGAGMRKHGGRAGKASGGSVSMGGGGGGGEARLQKIKKYGEKKLGVENKAFSDDSENSPNIFNKDTEFSKKSGGAC